MRRNIKNDKVLRAISIGLATMIAVTSTPVTVFAGEENGEDGSSGEPVAEASNETPAGGSAPAQSERGEGGSAPVTTITVENLISTQSSANSSIPVENLIQQGQPGSGLQKPVTVESASNDATTMVTTAEGQTQEISKMTTLVTAENEFAQKAKAIEKYIDILAGNGTAGKLADGTKVDYANQIKDAETMAENLEKNFGITVEIKKDETGNPLRDADGKIQYVIIGQVDADGNSLSITDKAGAVEEQINSVKGKNGEIAVATAALNAVENAITGEGKANAKVSAAETAMKNAQTKADGETARDNAKSKLDEDTTKKLNGIKDALETAVNEEDINKAVAAAAGASETAVNVAGTQHDIAKQELQNAETAAQDAQNNISNYSRQQMVNIATSAQKAADNAKEAERLATEAFNTAKQNEDDAKTALTNAQDGCSKAIKDAADVLTWYKGEIKKINDSITDANGPRATAKQAIIDANDAIDAALALMSSESGYTVTGAKTAFLAYNTALTAIENVNSALSSTTDSVSNLMYPQKLADKSKKTDEDKKILESYDFYNAEKKRKNTNLRLSCPVNEVGGTKRNLLNELETAFTTYKEAVAATGIAEENRKSAADTVAEINRIIDGIEGAYKGLYDMLGAEAEQDKKDLQALLSTGYSYKELEETVTRTNQGVTDAGNALVAQNKTLKGDESDQNLDAEGVLAKYNEAAKEGVQEGLNNEYERLDGLVTEKQNRINTIKNTDQPKAMNDAKEAQGTLNDEIGKMRQKYKEIGETGEFEMDAQGYVLNDAYRNLQAASDPDVPKNIKPDEYWYVNEKGKKEISPDDPQFNMWLWMADVKEDNDNVVYRYNSEKPLSDPELVSGIKNPDAEENYNEKKCTVGTAVVDGKERTVVYVSREYQYNAETVMTDISDHSENLKWDPRNMPNDAVDEIVVNRIKRSYDGLGLWSDDGKYDVSYSFDKEGNATGTVTFILDGKTRVMSYKIQYKTFSTISTSTLQSVNATYDLKLTEITTKTYVERQAFDFDKFVKTNLGGGLTDEAKKAKEKKDEIDKNVSTSDYEAAKINQSNKSGALSNLEKECGDLQTELDGKDGKPGLIAQKESAKTARDNNQKILDTLGTKASEYTDAKNYNNEAKDNLNRADNFDPDNVDNYADQYKDKFEEYKNKYSDAAGAKDKIGDEKKEAQGYQTTANKALADLNKVRKGDEDAQAIYEGVRDKIDKAQDRLDAVGKKLEVLKKLQKEAKTKLTGLTPISDKDLKDLYTRVNTALGGLKKFSPNDYAPVALISTDNIPATLNAAFLSNKLAGAIETAEGILETAQKNLSRAIENRQIAEINLKGGYTILDDDGKELFINEGDFIYLEDGEEQAISLDEFKENNIKYYAAKAQEEADKAAKALADWRAPESDGDGDDDSGSGSSSTPGAGSYTLPGAGTYAGFDLSGLTFDDLDTGVAGARTARRGAGSASGVLGVRTGEGDTKLKVEQPVIGNADDSTKDVKAGSDNQNLTKVDSELVPLADAPFEEGANMNLLWLLAAATAAGAGAYGYGKHRKSVAANEEAKKYKK